MLWHEEPELRYSRATTSTGDSESDWSEPVVVWPDGGLDIHLAEIAGRPAVAFIDSELDLRYASATTSAGTNAGDWNAAPNIDTCAWEFCSLAEVDGHPAIAYVRNNAQMLEDIIYIRSNTVSGSVLDDWRPLVFVTDTETGRSYAQVSLAVIAGRPAVGYMKYINEAYRMRYVRATTATGGSEAEWGSPVDLTADNFGDKNWTSLVVVDGRPLVAYVQKATDPPRSLESAHASTATGEGAADWPDPRLVDSQVDALSLAGVNGSAAMAYYSGNELKYAYYNP
jgi:hypothetical protein